MVNVQSLPLLVLGTAVIVAALLASAWLRERHPRRSLALLALPLGLGAFIAYTALTASGGYAAAYSFGAAYLFTAWIALVGAAMCVPRVARRAGKMGLVAAALVLATFYAVYLTCYGLGLCAWKNANQVPIPATAPR